MHLLSVRVTTLLSSPFTWHQYRDCLLVDIVEEKEIWNMKHRINILRFSEYFAETSTQCRKCIVKCVNMCTCDEGKSSLVGAN